MEEALNSNVRGSDAASQALLKALMGDPRFGDVFNMLWSSPQRFNVGFDPMQRPGSTNVRPNPGQGFNVNIGASGGASMDQRKGDLIMALLQAFDQSRMPGASTQGQGMANQINQQFPGLVQPFQGQ